MRKRIHLGPTPAELIAPFIAAAVTIGAAAWSYFANRPVAQIAAVNNADNGVKVVPASSPSPTVTVPLPTNTNSVK
jgi:hypothetical protein